MPRKRPAAKEKTRRKLGSAVALSQEAWDAWLVFLLQHQGPRMYILVALTGLFALRASEAAMLRREDIHLQASPPYINIPKERGRGKSPGDVPIMPEQASLLRLWLTEGVTVDE